MQNQPYTPPPKPTWGTIFEEIGKELLEYNVAEFPILKSRAVRISVDGTVESYYFAVISNADGISVDGICVSEGNVTLFEVRHQLFEFDLVPSSEIKSIDVRVSKSGSSTQSEVIRLLLTTSEKRSHFVVATDVRKVTQILKVVRSLRRLVSRRNLSAS